MYDRRHALAAVTETDHRGWLWVTVICCMVICPLFFLHRLFVRYRRYGLDDLAASFSFILFVTNSALLMAALRLGFGTASTETRIVTAAKLIFASETILYLALASSQISAFLFIRRLVRPGAWRSHACMTGVVMVVVWCFAAVLATNVTCSPLHSMLKTSMAERSCGNQDIQISTIMVLNIALELYIFVLAVLPSKEIEPSQRHQLIAIFACRLGLIALSISYLTLHLQYLSHGHPTIDLIPSLIIQEILTSYAFITNTTPTFFPISLSSHPEYPSSPIQPSHGKQKRIRRLSTQLSIFGDGIWGDHHVYKHRARVVANGSTRELARRGSTESRKGIVRKETFELKTATLSTVDLVV